MTTQKNSKKHDAIIQKLIQDLRNDGFKVFEFLYEHLVYIKKRADSLKK